MARPIVVDLFFDGNARTRASQKYGYGQRTADDETFATVDKDGGMLHGALAGRPLSVALPTGTTGGKGKLSNMLLSPANEGGVPTGFSPNKLDNTVVLIDPQINGDSVKIPLGRLRADMINTAIRGAAETVPTDGSIERTRLRAAAAYHALADEAEVTHIKEAAPSQPQTHTVAPQPAQPHVVQPQTVQPQAAQPHVVQVPVMHQAAQPVQQPKPVTTWGASPLGAFREKPPVQQAAMPTGEAPMPTVGAPQVAAPAVHVVFAFELLSANGTCEMSQDAYYHDVLHIPGFLVFVWDKRYTAAKPYWPPGGEGAPPTAVQREGDTNAYLVHTTPIRYSHRDFEYSVFVIDKVAPTA